MAEIVAAGLDPRRGAQVEGAEGELKPVAAEVGDRTAAEVVPAPPVAGMVEPRLVGTGRRRAEPEVPVEAGGNRIAPGGAIDAVGPAMSRMPDMDLPDRSEKPRSQHLETAPKTLRRTALIAGLGGERGMIEGESF